MITRSVHIRCPLDRYTFSVKPIREWEEQHCEGRVLNLFAGQILLAPEELRNDLDQAMPADSHCDALEFSRTYQCEKSGTILPDPPCACRKSMELYKGMVCSPLRQLKAEILRQLQPGRLVITFGYHSVVMGKSPGFHTRSPGIFSRCGVIHDSLAAFERYAPP